MWRLGRAGEHLHGGHGVPGARSGPYGSAWQVVVGCGGGVSQVSRPHGTWRRLGRSPISPGWGNLESLKSQRNLGDVSGCAGGTCNSKHLRPGCPRADASYPAATATGFHPSRAVFAQPRRGHRQGGGSQGWWHPALPVSQPVLSPGETPQDVGWLEGVPALVPILVLGLIPLPQLAAW